MDIFKYAIAASIVQLTFWQMYLSHRQSGHIRRNANVPPARFCGLIDATSHLQTSRYNLDKQRLKRASILIDALLMLSLTLGGMITKMWEWTGIIHHEIIRSVAFLALLLATFRLVSLPVSIARTFWLEEKYQYNKTSQGNWLMDEAKQAGLFALLGTPCLYAFCALWLIPGLYSSLLVWALWSAISITLIWAYPALLAPAFFRFQPLGNIRLAASISMINKAGHQPDTPVYVMDSSSRSLHGNAFFAGLGSSRRIVIFDTLLGKLSEREITAVIAHEIGHQHHGHLRKSLTLTLFSTLFYFLILRLASTDSLIVATIGLEHQHLMPVTVYCILLGSYLAYPLQPLRNHFSRKAEFEADAFASSVWPAQELINALIKLYRDNGSTLNPDPLHSLFYDTHPSAHARINHLESKAHESAGNQMRSTAGTAKP